MGKMKKRRTKKQIITLIRKSPLVLFHSAFCKLLWQKVTEKARSVMGETFKKSEVIKEKRVWEVIKNSWM